MASIVRHECRPILNRPVFIEGLPGVGNVGKTVADLLSRQLNAKLMARIYSEDLPPQVLLDDECVAELACQELWYVKDVNGHDLVFLLGNFQGTTPQGQYNLSQLVFDIILPYDPSMIVTLGGYGTGAAVSDPRVLGAVSDSKLKTMMEGFGVGFYPGEPQGGIVGAAAMLLGLGKIHGIDSVCIMGETSGYIVDHKSARNVLCTLGKMLGIEIDTSELQAGIDQIDEINSKALGKASEPEEDLTYIR